MADLLQLVGFGLPPTFPVGLMPEAGHRFVAHCMPGMSKAGLMREARARHWRPGWERLAHLDDGEIRAYGFALTIDGMVAPLVARMRVVARAVRSLPARAVDPRQLSLF